MEFLNEKQLELRHLPYDVIGLLVDNLSKSSTAIQCFSHNDGKWVDKKDNYLYTHGVYRIKPIPKPELVLPWEFLDERWKYAATGNLGIILTECKPFINKGESISIPEGDWICVTNIFKGPADGKDCVATFGRIVIKRPANV